jgi:hypothetical protein
VEFAGAVGGAIGAVGGVVGPVLAFRARREARRAEQHANEIADSVLRLERDRRHDQLRPRRPDGIPLEHCEHPEVGASRSLWTVVRLERDYRVRVDAVTGGSNRRLDLPLLLREGRTYRLKIEQMPHNTDRVHTEQLRFRFWPPGPGDGSWTCLCGKPTEPDDHIGHWEWKVPVHDDDVRYNVA